MHLCLNINFSKKTCILTTHQQHKMRKSILIICAFLSVISATKSENFDLVYKKVQYEDRKLYRVVPTISTQIHFLEELRSSNFGIVFWNGIGGKGEPVDLLSNPSLIEDIRPECEILGLEIVEVYSKVTIVMSDKKEPTISTPTTCQPEAKTSNNSQNLAPINKINGTNLYTGLFYKVGMKRFPNGWVTWTSETNDYNANFLQIDLDPSHWPHYAPGEQWQYDNQWVFGQTELPGCFNFTNRGVSTGVTTWSYSKKGSGQHLIISRKPEDVLKLSEGGEWRIHAFWTPVSSNQENYYQLKLKSMPQAQITWTYDKYGNFSHYLIAATKDEDMVHYQPGNKWYDDALFKFDLASDIQLEATIFDLEFTETPEEILLRANQTAIKESVKKLQIPNRSSAYETLEFHEEVKNINSNFSFHFDEDFFKLIPKVNANLKFVGGNECTNYLLNIGPDGKCTDLFNQTLRFKHKIDIPQHSNYYATLYALWGDHLTVPFTAKMRITGETERIMTDGSGKVGVGPVPADIIEEYFQSSGKTLHILERSVDSLTTTVSGQLTGSFPIEIILTPQIVHSKDVRFDLNN